MNHLQPTKAEVAHTLLSGNGTAAMGSELTTNVVPVLHAETETGTIVLVADDAAVSSLGLTTRIDSPEFEGPQVVLHIVSVAPIVQPTVYRSTLSATGRITLLDPDEVASALRARCASVPLGDILGYRSNARIYQFHPHNIDLDAGEQTNQLTPEEVLSATIDPLAQSESSTILQLNEEVGDKLTSLVRSLGMSQFPSTGIALHQLRTTTEASVIAIDRYGLTLQCTVYPEAIGAMNPAQEYGEPTIIRMRLPYPEPAYTPDDAIDHIHGFLLTHGLAAQPMFLA